MSVTSLDPHIFRAYDIRGVAHAQISAEACRLIGQGFGSTVQELYGEGQPDTHPTVVVGRDARTHSPELETAMIAGLMSTGCRVFCIGQTPSPLNYFAICAGGFDAGVQITASHNPKEDNGIKLQIRGAESFCGDDLQALRKRIEARRFVCGKGAREDFDVLTPYFEALTGIFPHVGQGKKIVIDAGNGVAGPVYTQMLRRVGCEVVALYAEPDGTFPHHPADPSKHATLSELQKRVRDEGAVCGFGYDGDGDRMGLVDERGTILSADEVLLLLSRDHLSRHPHASIVFTVSNSSVLAREITQWGGVPHLCKVGHSFVEHAMREHGALLGGEQSGHFFCGEDFYGYDDALVASLRILSMLAHDARPLSVMVTDFPKVYQGHELRPHCPDDRKSAVIERVIADFQAQYPVLTLDGARIDFGDGAWAGIRQSNTSPCLSICTEARSPEKLAEIQSLIMQEMARFPEVQMTND